MSDEEINEQELDRFEERYFGTFPEADAAAFDAELARDPELRERYELFVLSVRGVQSASTDRVHAVPDTLREQFRAIDRELDGQHVPVRTLFQPWMGWAAAVLVLLGAAGVWWSGGKETPQQLAEEFAVVEPGLPVLMGPSPRALDAIMNAYKQNEITTAGLLLHAAVQQYPKNDTLQYFSGVVALNEGGCATALDWFMRVPDTSVFAGKSRFNVALCALKENDLTRARKVLEDIARSNDAQFAARARSLLARLENV